MDDDAEWRASARAALEERGMSVVECADWQEALVHARPEPAVVVIDAALDGDVTGAQVALTLRRVYPRMPICVVADRFHPEDMAAARTSHLKLVPKPVNFASLGQQVEQLSRVS